MTFEIGLLLLIIAVALAFFAFELAPVDVVGLGVLLILILAGLLPMKDAFAGFGSDTVLMILGLLILTAALLRTGVIEIAGREILKRTGDHPLKLLLVIMMSASILSAFMSNTAATAFFVPVVIGIAAKARLSASQFLLPLAFASILSSSVTLISTSTNIVISGVMQQNDLPPMGMFELAPVGIPVTIVGLLYMFFIGRRMIPARATSDELETRFGMRPYVSEILILPESALIGKTLEESELGHELDITVLRVIRDKTRHIIPRGDTFLQPGDVLLVEGQGDEILKIKDIAGVEIKADVKLSDPTLQSEEIGLVEVLVLPKCPLLGRTLKSARFRERFGLQVLGVNHHGKNVQKKMSLVPLQIGDVLLVQGRRANIAALQDERGFRILGKVGEDRPNRKKARLAIGIFVGALVLGSLKVVPIPVAVLLGSFFVFVTRCITPEEAYREVEWKAIILIASMLALGAAMEQTGAAKYLAGLIVEWSGSAGSFWLLTLFFALTVALTQAMSNQAAAVVVLPVAIQTALQMDLNPRTFAMMIAVAASCSYLTPLEPSCLLVYGPGRYRFADFLKVGSILTILIYVVAILLTPRVWPLR